MNAKQLSIAVAVNLAWFTTSQAAGLDDTFRVVDGDSINVGKERHRLQGIDAPEMRQRCQRSDGTSWKCGSVATEAIKRKIGSTSVTCESNGRDRYKRHLSICHAGGVNLNAWMVRHGWAVAYRKYFPWFVLEEEAAKRERLGLWSGVFVMPWEWRRGKRLAMAGPRVSKSRKVK
jgi:endonuclease YncB( thermonuclease family)